MEYFNTDFFIRTFFTALSGIPVTMAITLVSLAVAAPLAFVMALSKLYRVPVAMQAVSFYISFVQGTPAVVQVMIIYSLVPSLLAAFYVALGGDSRVIYGTDPIVYAYIIFSLNTTAVLAEVFRSALQTVERGQLEAAYALGLSPVQAYLRIVLPQALVVALPNICNVTITLLKNTSLAFMMTVKDITAIVKIEAAYGFNYIEAYLDIWIIYIILCAAIEALFKLAERMLGSYRGQNMRGRTA
jgi:L-cystine transport system permease protein